MNENHWYILINAVWRRRYTEALNILKEHPELIEMRNAIGETVLHYLAVENDHEGVAWLHKNGFNINTVNDFGIPVIFEVALCKNKDLLKWFYTEGANFKAKDSDGNSIIKYLKIYKRNSMIAFVQKLCAPNNRLELTDARRGTVKPRSSA